MWLQKGTQTVLVPSHMPETIQRCLGDGWAEVPDPRPAPPAMEAAVVEVPVVDAAVVVASAVQVAEELAPSASPPAPRPHAATRPALAAHTRGRR
jgi:hypothetical protein